MAGQPPIFHKPRLTPARFRTVAELRLGDAQCLLNSGDRKRANGVLYMGGFVIECLLKALLLERHRNLQGSVDPAALSSSDREVHRLLHRHELDAMLVFLPDVRIQLTTAGGGIWQRFRVLCEQWTVYARYSPMQAELKKDAQPFLETVKEVKQWLETIK